MPGPSKLRPKQWRDFYTAALRANGDVFLRQLQVSVAATCALAVYWRFPRNVPQSAKKLPFLSMILKFLGGYTENTAESVGRTSGRAISMRR